MTGGTVVVLGPTGRNFAAGMSGGVALRAGPRPGAGQRRAGRPGAASTERRARAARPGRAAPRRDGFGGRRRLLADWAQSVREFTESCRATTSGCWRPCGPPKPPAATSTRRSWRRHVPDPNGFLRYDRRLPARRPVPVRHPRLAGGVPAGRRRADPRAGHPLHGLRHPVLPRRLPAGQPHPGLERPGPHRQLGRGDRVAARHQQLPGVHRPALPGAVRGGLRARHRRRPAPVTIKQVEVEIIDRGRGRDGRVDPGPRPSRTGKTRRRWSAPARPGWPPRSSSPAPVTTVTVYERDDAHRRPAALRHPRLQAGEAAHRPAAGPARRRGRAVRDRRRRRRRRHRRAVARRARRGAARLRRAAGPGHRRRRRAGRCAASTWRWSTWSPPTGSCSRRGDPLATLPTARRSTPPASTWSSSVAATPRADCLGVAHRQGAAGVHPARPLPAAADGAGRGARPVADLAVGAAQLPGARGGRRPGLRGRRAGVRGRRHRPGPRGRGSPR